MITECLRCVPPGKPTQQNVCAAIRPLSCHQCHFIHLQARDHRPSRHLDRVFLQSAQFRRLKIPRLASGEALTNLAAPALKSVRGLPVMNEESSPGHALRQSRDSSDFGFGRGLLWTPEFRRATLSNDLVQQDRELRVRE